MSEKKFWNFGSAWKSKKNKNIINVRTNSDKSEIKLLAVHLPSVGQAGLDKLLAVDGVLTLDNFFLKFNESKREDGANPDWPDYQATFTTGGEEKQG